MLKTFSEYALRDELPAAMFYLHVAVRDVLNRVIRWHIAMNHRFAVELDILDSHFGQYLRPELYGLYKKTYPTAEAGSIQAAWKAMIQLFRTVAGKVAERFGYRSPAETEREMLAFTARLRAGAVGPE